MRRANLAKVEFYRTAIYLAMSLIEERTGKKLATLDADIERKVEKAIEFSSVVELKKLHLALDEMYTRVKKKALIA